MCSSQITSLLVKPYQKALRGLYFLEFRFGYHCVVLSILFGTLKQKSLLLVEAKNDQEAKIVKSTPTDLAKKLITKKKQ